MDIAGQEQPARLGRGGHQLDLGQVGPVVLAMPQLHQPVVVDGVVAIGGGGVEADPLHRRQRIDLALGVPEVGFQLVPDLQIAETFQDQGQAVVAELDGPNGLADDGLDGVPKTLDPLLDVGLAVVGLGENVGDPDRDQPAVGETLVEGVRREMAVEDLGKLELDQKAETAEGRHRHVRESARKVASMPVLQGRFRGKPCCTAADGRGAEDPHREM